MCYPDSRAAKQPAEAILGGKRMLLTFNNIFECYEPPDLPFFINYRKLFYFILLQDFFRLQKCCANGCSNKVLLCHQLLDFNMRIRFEAQIAVGKYSYQLIIIINNREPRYLVPLH